MKKVLLFSAALLIAGVSFGQSKVKFGIVAGPNFSSATIKNLSTGSGKETTDLLVGVRGGLTVDLPLADEFYIGTGLLYAGKGGKNIMDADIKASLSYLQLPINFLFKPEVGAGNLSLGAGPYVAYGVGGKIKTTVGSVETKTDAFGDDGGLKRFDAGLGIVAGYEMKGGLYLGINADLGLVNTLEDTDGDASWKNTSFGVSVGYKF
jgi:hypothetical protein